MNMVSESNPSKASLSTVWGRECWKWQVILNYAKDLICYCIITSSVVWKAPEGKSRLKISTGKDHDRWSVCTDSGSRWSPGETHLCLLESGSECHAFLEGYVRSKWYPSSKSLLHLLENSSCSIWYSKSLILASTYGANFPLFPHIHYYDVGYWTSAILHNHHGSKAFLHSTTSV